MKNMEKNTVNQIIVYEGGVLGISVSIVSIKRNYDNRTLYVFEFYFF